MSPQDTMPTGQYLEIRVKQDGSHIHIRADAYIDGNHKGYSASRTKGQLDMGSWVASTATTVRQAVENVLAQQPLF